MFANICLPEIRFIIVQLFTIIRISIYVYYLYNAIKELGKFLSNMHIARKFINNVNINTIETIF